MVSGLCSADDGGLSESSSFIYCLEEFPETQRKSLTASLDCYTLITIITRKLSVFLHSADDYY